MQGMGK